MKNYLRKPVACILFMFCMSLLADQSSLAQTPEARLDALLEGAAAAETPGQRIVALSAPFLGTPYAEDTLVGGPGQAERLVIDLDRFDCFTLLDTVEALRRSASPDQFAAQLTQVRYRNGLVDYRARRHFFSDWVAEGDGQVRDVTVQVGQGRAVGAWKHLNQKADGGLWLAGIAVSPRQIFYIPTDALDGRLLAALQPGDYVGIYTPSAGLDVSHTGLIAWQGQRAMLRHASSRSGLRQVVDEDLLGYLQGKPGLVVYRVVP
jgi:hypothetical protein